MHFGIEDCSAAVYTAAPQYTAGPVIIMAQLERFYATPILTPLWRTVQDHICNHWFRLRLRMIVDAINFCMIVRGCVFEGSCQIEDL